MMANEKRYTEWLTGVKHLVYKVKKSKQTDIATMAGVQKEHINAVLKGRRSAGSALQDNISWALGYSYDSIRHLGQLILEGMDADMALEAMKAGNVNLEGGIGLGGAEKNLTWLPLISFVQAGGWCAVVDNLQPGDAEDWVPYPGRIGPHAFALRVNGPSMEPRFEGETCGTICEDYIDSREAQGYIGETVQVDLHNENGTPIKVKGTVVEILIED